MSRNLLIALGALVVVVLGGVFVVMPMVFDDDADEMPDTAEIAAEDEADPDEAEAEDAPDLEADEPDDAVGAEELEGFEDLDGDEPLDETFEVFSARDPFQQLVVEGDAVPVADGTDTGTGTGDGDGGAPADGDGDDDGDAGEPSEVTVDGTIIEIESIYTGDDGEDRVELLLNGSGYTLAEGERANDRLEVVSIDPPCATMLLGDDRFIACEGDRIRK